MEIFVAKVIAMVALGFSSMFVGILPSCFSLNSRHQWPLLLSLLLCFGAGVLMSTSLVHMLPEIRISMTKHKEYAEIILCAGFFLVYIIDEVVHFFYEDLHDHETESTRLNPRELKRHHSHPNKMSYGTTENENYYSRRNSLRQLPFNPNYFHEGGGCSDDVPPSQLCHVGEKEPCNAAPIANMGLLLALCIHSILEGLAIGLQEAPLQVLLLLGAVASHKLVVGFCLGAELASSQKNTLFGNLLCIIIFSLGSVIGIGMGMVIIKVPENIYGVVLPIINGLAAGTLLYVTLSEVLPRERARWHKQHSRRRSGLLQLMSVLIGFTIMTGITIFIDRHNI